MADAIEATTTAIYHALAADGAVSVPVYGTAPSNAAFPNVIVADVDGVASIGRAGDPSKRMLVTVLAQTEAEQKESCERITGECTEALDGVTLTSVAGWRIAVMLEIASVNLADDGLGYVGGAIFSVLAIKD